jgi:hypothetical protein
LKQEKIYMTQPRNREWVSLVECISIDGRRTRLWVILKANQHQKAWFSTLPDAHIAVSVNGWTDNETGLEWIEKWFEPETRCGDEYRLLLFDGHASHITTKAIRSNQRLFHYASLHTRRLVFSLPLLRHTR